MAMQPHAPDAAFTHMPRSGPGLRRLAWLGAACLAGLLGYKAFVLLSDRLQIATSRQFFGQLEPDQSPITVELPAGVPLAAILVQRGDRVLQGQTLAVFDRVALQAQIADQTRIIFVSQIWRACLLNAALPEPGFIEYPALDLETRSQLRAALLQCRTDLEDEAALRARLSRDLGLQAQELDLLNKQLALLFNATTRPLAAAARAASAIRLESDIRRVRSAQAALVDQAAQVKSARDRARIERLIRLATALAEARARRDALVRYDHAPRLAAPVAGRVVRTRAASLGVGYPAPVEIVELRDDQAAAYHVRLTLPRDMADALPVGKQVKLTLLGFLQMAAPLTGQVSAMHVNPDGKTLEAEVSLSDDSTAYLSDPENRIALRGHGTASRILAETVPESLRQILWAEALRALRAMPELPQTKAAQDPAASAQGTG